jgi:hypothetical protein
MMSKEDEEVLNKRIQTAVYYSNFPMYFAKKAS